MLLVLQYSKVYYCVDIVDFSGRDWFANNLVSWESSMRMQKGFPRRKQVQGIDITQ